MNVGKAFAIALCVALCGRLHTAQAKALGLASSPFVEHPVHHPLDGRTSSIWRTKVGTWGENLAQESLRLRGFDEIHEIKNASNNGIDRIAIKRAPNGELIDAKLVEIKTSRSEKPKLAHTRYGGRQMSRKWLASNLWSMRSSGDPVLKKLALELSRFRKASGRSIESFGELTHVNTRTGWITGYSADGRTLRYTESLSRLLSKLQANAHAPNVRTWATRSLSQLDQIRSSSMTLWLGSGSSGRSTKMVLGNSGHSVSASRALALRHSRSAVATRTMQRAAGRIALVVALAMDAKELFDTEHAYRTGAISARQRNVQLASTVGGAAGAFAGAWAGGATGAWLGGFGGPFAWATVPAGGFIGAVAGGVGGYFGGSAVAGYGATAWYNSIDNEVRSKFELSWLGANGEPL